MRHEEQHQMLSDPFSEYLADDSIEKVINLEMIDLI
jgi:hypothetical protein